MSKNVEKCGNFGILGGPGDPPGGPTFFTFFRAPGLVFGAFYSVK